MVVLNRIYTRTGDDGTTALGSGDRRKKYDLRVAAYGTLDEVNAVIGVVRLHTGGRCRARSGAGAHPERPVRRRGRPLPVGEGAGRRAAHRHRRAGRSGSRTRSTGSTPTLRRCARSSCRAAARPPPTCISRARYAGAPSASWWSCATSRARPSPSLAEVRQPAVGFPVRRRPLRQRQGRARRAVGAGAEPVARHALVSGRRIVAHRVASRRRRWPIR